MESGLKSLSKLFTERLFRIPDYQRGYSWQSKQLKDFWSDLEQLEPGRHHYLGVLTLEVVQERVHKRWTDDAWVIQAKNYTAYHVVDGQQRLTTIVILLQCVLESIKSEVRLNYSSKDEIQSKYIYLHKDGTDGSFLFGYEKDNPSYECLKTKILQKRSSRYTAGETTIYTKNLVRAKEFFTQKLEKLDTPELQTLFTKITQQLLFNVFNIEKEVDVHVAFETMNNRGLQLSNLELLKNRLIYLTTRLGEATSNVDSLRRTINDSWKTVYYYLGKNPSSSLSDDFFLQIHYLLYFAPQLLEEHAQTFESYLHHADHLYKAYLLEDRFTLRRLNSPKPEERVTSKTLYHYSMDLKRVVELYYHVSFPAESSLSPDEKLWLTRLGRLATTSHTREILVLLLLLLSLDGAIKNRPSVLETVENYFFLTSMLPYRYRKKNLTLQIGIELIQCAAKKTSLLELLAKIKEQLEAFRSDEGHAEALLEGLSERGYYDWQDLKYFMYEYECHLKTRARRKSDKIGWETFIEDGDDDHTSIEHILPQTPSDPYWKERLKGLTPSQVKKLTNSLGNLVATSGPRNSSLRNRSFPEKARSKDRKTSYSYGSYSEIEVAQSEHWGPQEILARGLSLISFMSERWGVKFSSDNAKVKYLGLEFLK